MASIRQDPRSKARWQVLYVDVDGTQRTRRLRGVTTKGQAVKVQRSVERRLADGLYGFEDDQPPVAAGKLVIESIAEWSHLLGRGDHDGSGHRGTGGERNGIADGHHARRWLVDACPVLKGVECRNFSLDAVWAFLAWLPDTGLAPGSQRNLFTLLSRWCSWALTPAGKRLLPHNPCRDIPQQHRPQPLRGDKASRAWVRDDETLQKLMAALPTPVDLALWLGNRSGLRLGEVFGLRLSDLAEMDATTTTGQIRVCRSFGGPLKESKRGEWSTKWVPAPVDAGAVLGPLIAARRAQGATDGDLLFVPAVHSRRPDGWKGFLPATIGAMWRKVRKVTGYAGDWKSATRHSYVSRNVMAGVDIEAISRSIGHASVETTRKNYEHVIRIKYPDGLHAPALRAAVTGTGQQVNAAEAKPGTDLDAGQVATPRRLS